MFAAILFVSIDIVIFEILVPPCQSDIIYGTTTDHTNHELGTKLIFHKASIFIIHHETDIAWGVPETIGSQFMLLIYILCQSKSISFVN